jgi:hypothetical protein
MMSFSGCMTEKSPFRIKKVLLYYKVYKNNSKFLLGIKINKIVNQLGALRNRLGEPDGSE